MGDLGQAFSDSLAGLSSGVSGGGTGLADLGTALSGVGSALAPGGSTTSAFAPSGPVTQSIDPTGSVGASTAISPPNSGAQPGAEGGTQSGGARSGPQPPTTPQQQQQFAPTQAVQALVKALKQRQQRANPYQIGGETPQTAQPIVPPQSPGYPEGPSYQWEYGPGKDAPSPYPEGPSYQPEYGPGAPETPATPAPEPQTFPVQPPAVQPETPAVPPAAPTGGGIPAAVAGAAGGLLPGAAARLAGPAGLALQATPAETGELPPGGFASRPGTTIAGPASEVLREGEGGPAALGPPDPPTGLPTDPKTQKPVTPAKYKQKYDAATKGKLPTKKPGPEQPPEQPPQGAPRPGAPPIQGGGGIGGLLRGILGNPALLTLAGMALMSGLGGRRRHHGGGWSGPLGGESHPERALFGGAGHPGGAGAWPYHHPTFGWRMQGYHPGEGWQPMHPNQARVFGFQPDRPPQQGNPLQAVLGGMLGAQLARPGGGQDGQQRPGGRQAPGGGQTGGAPPQGPWSGNPVLSTLVGAESSGLNSGAPGQGPGGDGGIARGYFNIQTPTWGDFSPYVPGASQWATADAAPYPVQEAVARTIPVRRFGDRTRAILHQRFGAFDENLTVGDLADRYGATDTATARRTGSTPTGDTRMPVPLNADVG